MTAFRTDTTARPAAFLMALAVTVAMLSSVNALSTKEYRHALTAQAAAAGAVAQSATVAPSRA